MVHLDTSFLIRAGVRDAIEQKRLRSWIVRGEKVRLSAVAWAEYLCGPPSADAIDETAEFFGEPAALTARDATLAAQLFNFSGRRRRSLADCMIAAIAMNAGAALATSNPADFEPLAEYGLVLARHG